MANSSILRRLGQALAGTSLCLGGSWLLVVCGGGLLMLGVASLLYVGVFFSLGLLGVGLLMAGICLIMSALSTPRVMNKIEDNRDWVLSHEMAERRQRQQPSDLSPKPSARFSNDNSIAFTENTSFKQS